MSLFFACSRRRFVPPVAFFVRVKCQLPMQDTILAYRVFIPTHVELLAAERGRERRLSVGSLLLHCSIERLIRASLRIVLVLSC